MTVNGSPAAKPTSRRSRADRDIERPRPLLFLTVVGTLSVINVLSVMFSLMT